MLGKLAPGDVVTVTRIDRLARSTCDLFAIVKRIVDAKGAIPILGRTVGRHRHQHRALDADGTRRTGGRGA
jgi:Resolvase, N terminal domain